MRISIFGLGCAGAVTGACIADSGHEVISVVAGLANVKHLQEGNFSTREPRLDILLGTNIAAGNLKATTCCEEAVMNTDMSLICPGRPSDINHIRETCMRIGRVLRKKDAYHIVLLRCADAPGAAGNVAIPVLEECAEKKSGVDFGFSNIREFMREGTAIHDYFHPPEMIIGVTDERTAQAVLGLHEGINAPKVTTDIATAERRLSY